MKSWEQERETEETERDRERLCIPQMHNIGEKTGSQPSQQTPRGHQSRQMRSVCFEMRPSLPCAVPTKALLTFVSKCESELAPDLWDQGCVSRVWPSRRLATWVVQDAQRLESLAQTTGCRCARPGFCPDDSGAGLPTFPTGLGDMFPKLSCAPSCGPGREETDRAKAATCRGAIQQVFIEHLLYARHCSKHWNTAKGNPCSPET